MADPWFTDADVDAVERVIHDEVDLNGHRWAARAVLAALAPRIAQEQATAWDQGYEAGWRDHFDAEVLCSDEGYSPHVNPHRADDLNHGDDGTR